MTRAEFAVLIKPRPPLAYPAKSTTIHSTFCLTPLHVDITSACKQTEKKIIPFSQKCVLTQSIKEQIGLYNLEVKRLLHKTDFVSLQFLTVRRWRFIDKVARTDSADHRSQSNAVTLYGIKCQLSSPRGLCARV